MGRSWIVALVALGLMWLGGRANEAAAAPPDASARAHAATSDVSSQRRRLRRAPVRITVYPQIYPGLIGPRRFGIDRYPRPYPYDWPGPFAKRDCVAWLAAQARPSGPVIVPRQRCWWIPG